MTPTRTPTGVIGGIEPTPTRVTTERTDHRTTTEAVPLGTTTRRAHERMARGRRGTRTSSIFKPRRNGDARLPSRHRARRSTGTDLDPLGGWRWSTKDSNLVGIARTTLRAVCRTSGACSSSNLPFRNERSGKLMIERRLESKKIGLKTHVSDDRGGPMGHPVSLAAQPPPCGCARHLVSRPVMKSARGSVFRPTTERKSRRRMSRAASRPRKVERLLTRLEGDDLRDEVAEIPEITQIPELHTAIGARLRARDWGGRERFRTMARHGCAAEAPTTHAAQRARMGTSTGELPRADVVSKLDRRLHGESLDKTKCIERQEEKSSHQKEMSTESCDLNRVLSRSPSALVDSPRFELSSVAQSDRASCARTRARRTRPARCSRPPPRPT